MDNLCITCLCGERNLISIAGTELQDLYLQILNEPITKMLEPYLLVCWECQGVLKHFQNFKSQTQQCYAELFQHTQESPKINLKKKVKIKIEVNRPSSDVSEIDHNDPFVETDPVSKFDCKVCGKIFDAQEELIIHATELHMPKGRAPKKQLLQMQKVDSISYNAPEEDTHFEPETFVDEIKLEKKIQQKKRVCKRNVKLKKPPKMKIKRNVNIKKEVKPSDVSDVEHDDPFVESDPVSDFDGNVSDKLFDAQEELAVHTAEEHVTTELTNGEKRTRSKEVLPDKPQCVECGKMFSSKKTYKYHLNVLHKGQNRYPCPRCGKVYQWKSNLGRHMRSHKARDSGELYCDICDKKFASVATFRQHLRASRRHVSETDFSFMCNECGKRFVNKTRLRDHIDWEHLNKIKFKCQLCNKPFKCHTSLYVHLQNVHRNKEKKDNLCHVCGKSYQNAAKLRYHIVAMHTTETPYRCERCGAAFGWYSSLYRHVREVHHKMKLNPKKCKKPKKLSDDHPTPHLNLGPVE